VARADNIKKWADMLSLWVKAPRTVDELASLTGLDRGVIYRWRKALEDEGLITRCGKTAVNATIWAWNPPTKDNP
jgi:DNA-binding MarR family transcriptional regulator